MADVERFDVRGRMDSVYSKKSARVPGYAWDAFVSYAHVDNFKPRGAERGWVDELVDNLVGVLSRQLHGSNRGRVWLDRRLDPGAPFPEQLKEAVQAAATLIVILSDAYLSSDWCRREREFFFDAVERAGGRPDQRVFIVDTARVDREHWPAALHGHTAFTFWEMSTSQDRPRPLAWPLPSPEDRVYYQRLDDVAVSMAERLRALAEEREQASRAAPPPPSDRLPVAEPAVLLAEVAPDLRERREELARSLQQVGIRVLPERYYPRDPSTFEERLRADLGECALFVQLMGRYLTVSTEELPGGYEALQRAGAHAEGVPALCWRDPSLDPDVQDLSDAPHLTAPDVMALPFAKLHAEVVRLVRQSVHRKQRRDLSPGKLVLIRAERWDGERVSEISNALRELGIDYFEVPAQESLFELASDEALSPDGLLFVSEANRDQWVELQLREVRRLLLHRRRVNGARTSLRPPPGPRVHAHGVRVDRQAELRARIAEAVYFECTGDPEFQDFLTALQSGPEPAPADGSV